KLVLLFLCMLSPCVVLSFHTNLSLADDVNIDNLLNKCEIAPEPKPSVMVYDYKLSPEALMPGDVGVLTITLKNMQDKPIKRKISITTSYPNVNTETYYTMDAYIKEAYIVEREFKVYNRYTSAGVLGPNEKVDLAFKIKAPPEEGIYMLKFVADIEDAHGESSKGIRYFIPVVVTGTVKLLPQEVTEDEVRLEVVNEGLSDVNSVYVVAVPAVTTAGVVECQPERIYIGKIEHGESAIAAFKVDVNETRTEGGVPRRAVFKAVYKNGINEHESGQISVAIPCPSSGYDEAKREQTEFSAALTPAPATGAAASTPAPALKLRGFGGVFAFTALFIVVVAFTLAFVKRRREVKEEG
ncbi:MAG: hypothetical protein J7I99_01540, partial [Methanophagales archaeon]|nr:hypothetical protein [Methanophagales archaeon]